MKKLILFCLSIMMATLCNAQNIYECTGDNVNVRTGPGTDYAVMTTAIARPGKAQLFRGQKVEYLGVTKNGFMKVKQIDQNWMNETGWVYARYLKKAGTAAKNTSLTALERKVVGKHMLSLQWISWDYFGKCEITKLPDGTLSCVGEQLSKEHPGDFLRLDGTIEIVNEKHLIFDGDISIKVYHLNNGEEYTRTGRYDFKSTQNRRYWRAQNLEVIDACDYVDIYFK